MNSECKSLSPWAYFSYSILFNIPVIGFILLIVFSLDSSNINRRNYARSYWCWLVIFIVLVVVLIISGFSIDSVVPDLTTV